MAEKSLVVISSSEECKIYKDQESAINGRAVAGNTNHKQDIWEISIYLIFFSMGEFVVELYWRHAPNTCRNFAELVRRGYYNGTKFHRIIRDFMIQGGDPTGTGKGGTSIYGRQFDDEIHEELKHTGKYIVSSSMILIRLIDFLRFHFIKGAGILSMANSGPDSNGSQFFISLAPTQWLDGKHTIFGMLVII
uniref:Peptidyl-prolyl cis-trans isomerase n=1 Tax=Timema shepardi TaxID=629360 RepID=A0A7R9AND7_TIMSH|nr:unnamed protein product [Timema shepardi]